MDTEKLTYFAIVAGRIAIAALFLHESWFKLMHYDLTITYMVRYGLPAWLLPGALAVELVGGIALACGYGARYAAIALAAFSVVAAFVFHRNWADQNQLLHFEKNLAIAGGLVVFAALWGYYRAARLPTT